MIDGTRYLPTLTTQHLSEASQTLKRITELVNHPGPAGQGIPRRVRVGHFEHGAFLSVELRSFAMLEVDQHGLLLDAAGHGEAIFAMVVNQPISVQIATLLEFLASFLERQKLTAELRSGRRQIDDIDALALSADERSSKMVRDYLRIDDWENVARSLSDRARNDGFALEIRFAEPLLEKWEIDRRVPLLRHVYNTQDVIRAAIDRVAGVSAGLRLEGDNVPPGVLRRIQAQVDISRLRKFMAHLMRDAFVCGNGYLTFGDDGRVPMRLLPPEFVRHTGRDKYEFRDGASADYRPVEGHVLHLTGAKQVNSEYGLSMLEPFVQITATSEVLDAAVTDVAQLQPPPDKIDEASKWLAQVIELRERTFSESAERIARSLGGATDSMSNPPGAELYFPGLQFMGNAAVRLRFGDPNKTDSSSS